MKKYLKIEFFSIILLMCSCSTFKNINDNNNDKDSFKNDFFNNISVYNSLKDYYNTKNIIIYDREKTISTKKEIFNQNNLEIVVNKPNGNNYFFVYSYILNKNLAMLVLSTSDGDKGIIYYIRKNDNKKSWNIMNIIPKNSR